MMKKPLVKLNLEQSDIFYFGLILLYAVYAYIGNVIINCNHKSNLIDLPCLPTFLLYIISISVFGIVFYNIFKRNWTTSKSGLNLGKGFWVVLGAAIIFGFILSYQGQTFTMSSFIQFIPSLFYFTASEIVLRAILICWIIKIFGKTETATRLAIVISAIVFAIANEPYSGNLLVMYGISILFSIVYVSTRSILLMVTFGMFTTVIYAPIGNAQLSYFPMIGLMTLALYLLLAIPAQFLERRHLASDKIE